MIHFFHNPAVTSPPETVIHCNNQESNLQFAIVSKPGIIVPGRKIQLPADHHQLQQLRPSTSSNLWKKTSNSALTVVEIVEPICKSLTWTCWQPSTPTHTKQWTSKLPKIGASYLVLLQSLLFGWMRSVNIRWGRTNPFLTLSEVHFTSGQRTSRALSWQRWTSRIWSLLTQSAKTHRHEKGAAPTAPKNHQVSSTP